MGLPVKKKGITAAVDPNRLCENLFKEAYMGGLLGSTSTAHASV